MIGACLMGHPTLVADCIKAMQDAVTIPVTVKCRIGIDDFDSEPFLTDFIGTVADAGACKTFIVHARIAILQGLSPKENREVPPLNYERVYRLKQTFPHLEIVINGGIKTLDECHQHLQKLDGVMLGREVYHNPWLLQQVDPQLFDRDPPVDSREQVLEQMMPYLEEQLCNGVALHHITRHILGLYHGQHGGKRFRRILSEQAHKKNAGIDVLENAIHSLHLTEDSY